MNLVKRYHSKVLRDIYERFPGMSYDIDALWPLFACAGAFGLIDLAFALNGDARLIVMVTCIAPGIIWLCYLIYHNLRHTRSWSARQRENAKDEQ